MNFQLHAQSDKSIFIIFNQYFRLFSAVEHVYQIQMNKISRIAASI